MINWEIFPDHIFNREIIHLLPIFMINFCLVIEIDSFRYWILSLLNQCLMFKYYIQQQKKWTIFILFFLTFFIINCFHNYYIVISKILKHYELFNERRECLNFYLLIFLFISKCNHYFQFCLYVTSLIFFTYNIYIYMCT